MSINFLAFAVPFFIVFMILEYIAYKKRKWQYASIENTVSNISIGIAERLCDALLTGSFFSIYQYLFENYALFTIKSNITNAFLLLLATDFLWYWYHRLAHEWNIFWAVHIVHHQSNEYNYTVSARITIIQTFVRMLFWSFLPILGFPVPMIFTILIIHGCYPFFLHTKLIKKLGILEYILVTPSHHRVHHASNEMYLDKNYGDVFIIWDKLFNTFKKETEEPIYGLTKPIHTYSFLWQHFHYFIELIFQVRKTKGIRNKIAVLFAAPSNLSSSIREEAEQIFLTPKNGLILNNKLKNYVIAQIVLLIISLFIFLLFEEHSSSTISLCFLLFTLLILINCGAIMEQKKWVFNVEFARFILIMFFLKAFNQPHILIAVYSLIVLIALTQYNKLKGYYINILFDK